MATYVLTLSGSLYAEAIYTDPDGDKGGVKLTITEARYNNSTNKIELDWSLTMRSPSSGRPNCYALYASLAGTELYFEHGSPLYGWNSYRDGTVVETGTLSINANKGTNQSIALAVKGMFYYSWSQTRWDNNTGCTSGSATATAPVPGDPSISVSISASTQASRGGSNGKATVTASGFSAGTNGGTYTYSVTNNGATVNNTASKETTGLKNNTTYSYSATITNSFGLSKTVSGTYYLAPVAPGLTVSASPSRTTATLTLTPSYDTKRKFGSYSVKYGTSTSYGSTATSGSLSNLAANTKYYYSVTVTDANDGGAYSNALTSSAVTGSFTTTGNAPSITALTVSADRTSLSFSPTVTYDNTTFASRSIKYGTTTSYGSTTTGSSITGLTPNTKYYYSMTVTDSVGRTSAAYTGNKTTTGNAPTLSAVSATPSRTGATLVPTVSYDTNASLSSYSVRYGTTTSYGSTGTSLSLSNLTPNTKYYYSLTVTDNWGRTSSAKTGNFTTTGNAPVINTHSVTPALASGTFNYTATYDTNASYASIAIRYGTSTSYGSTATSTTISGLAHNTKYYYSATVTDNWSRTSSAVTGNFTTLGNAPTISSVSATPSRTGATLAPSVTYDTNASLGSYSVQYGTSTSYGSTSTSTTLSGLTANTKYYYRIRVTDSFGYTSAWKTGNFTTTGNNPTATLGTVTPAVTSCTIGYTGSYDTNASFASVTVEYGTTTSYGTSVSSNTLTGLAPSTNYYFRLKVTDNWGRSSSWKTGSFTTLDDQAKIRVKTASGWIIGKAWVKTSSGWVKAKKVYVKTSNGWKEGV